MVVVVVIYLVIIMKYLYKYICIAFVFASLVLMSSSSVAAVQEVYLSVSGSDVNNGLSVDKSVASLQRALDIAVNLPSKKLNLVRVLVSDGVYRRQTAVTKGSPEGQKLQIRPLNQNKPRPRFDGDGAGGTWLSVNSASGAPSSVEVYGLEIVNFETAISFNGNRKDFSKSNGKNIVRNNIFMNIGQIASDVAKPSTAAIRMVNSDGNTIFRNEFVNIRNREHCSLLHAIYVAHNSTENLIDGNIFQGGCGDAIRFRDASGRNVVKGNTFKDAWDKAPVSDWYCDGENRDDCTKAEGECPSFNNLLSANNISSKKGNSVLPTLVYGSDISRNCQKAVSDKRFIVR